jgi:putative SOS response-associated peptidase YedK
MCGRFTQSYSWKEVHDFLNLIGEPLNLEPRYNLAPTQAAQVVRADEAGKRRLAFLRWGLVPFWAKDPDGGPRPINARAETVAEKPTFREAFRKRRCLVPADGFYEWQKREKGKQPYRIMLKDERVFAFAGLWELWKGEEEIESFTIIVTDANDFLKPIHDRMPVILDPKDYALWLDPDAHAANDLKPLLRPCPSDKLSAYPVSRFVNSPKNDDPACIEPLRETEDAG